MSGEPALEYAYARLSARLAGRPDERLWRQLRSARSLQAAIDTVRGSPAAPYVAGVGMRGTVDEVELAFRQHLRARIRELVGWAPQPWRAALRWSEVLADLPAIAQLLVEGPPPRWLRVDPHLAAYAEGNLATRRARMAHGSLAPLLAAMPAAATTAKRIGAMHRGGERLHPLLQAWQAQWQRLWPPCRAEENASLHRLAFTVRAHLAGFGALPVQSAAAARERLVERTRRQLHDAAAQPAALFAYLLLVALDLERLRGEFVLRAAGADDLDREAA